MPHRPRSGRAGTDRGWLACIAAIARRPWLWPTALRTAGRTAPRSWWRRPPFLPAPDRAYLRFRMETQYGDARRPAAADLVDYLEWCRAQEQVTRR